MSQALAEKLLPDHELAKKLRKLADDLAIWPDQEATLREAATRLEAEQWRPIEEAPRDGTWVLGYSPDGLWARISWGRNRFGEKVWCSADYWWHEGERFTHFRLLPKAPEE